VAITPPAKIAPVALTVVAEEPLIPLIDIPNQSIKPRVGISATDLEYQPGQPLPNTYTDTSGIARIDSVETTGLTEIMAQPALVPLERHPNKLVKFKTEKPHAKPTQKKSKRPISYERPWSDKPGR
jgi:hypothetical protein